MILSSDDLVVGRLLTDENDYMVIELAKNDEGSFTLDPDVENHFFTMCFVRKNPITEEVEFYRPWDS